MSETEVLKKVDNIFELTESQKDRQLISNLIREDLLEFLRNQIVRVTSGSELRQLVERQLKNRLETENEDNEALSDGALLKLYEILSMNEANLTGKILELFKETQKIIIQTNTHPIENIRKSDTNEFSKEEIQTTKKILDIIETVKELKKAEFNEEEFKQE